LSGQRRSAIGGMPGGSRWRLVWLRKDMEQIVEMWRSCWWYQEWKLVLVSGRLVFCLERMRERLWYLQPTQTSAGGSIFLSFFFFGSLPFFFSFLLLLCRHGASLFIGNKGGALAPI